MCGRYALSTPPEVLAELLRIHSIHLALLPRYNIAPTQDVPVVRQGRGGAREMVPMRWGLIPSWAKDASIGSKLINARSESAADKPAFRSAFRRRRCVIPASGFYEWKKAGGAKQPHYIERADGAPLLMAGLWESWPDPARGTRVDSCTILTTPANEALSALHNRMPAVLEPEECDAWLEESSDDPEKLRQSLRPAAERVLTFYPVSARVNSPHHDDPSLLDCVSPPASDAPPGLFGEAG
jgi:putative SOS response-associated peptidase YedK